MKQLTCEMCGSTELVKQDGFFVCQTCGCKYSVEEAKKMMIEGTVDIQGTVKVDDSSRIDNYYTMAVNAYNASNQNEAENYCNKIIEIDPTNHRAWFLKGKAAGWQSTLQNSRLSESVSAFVTAIINSPEDEKHEIIEEAKNQIKQLSKALINLRGERFAKWPDKEEADGFLSDIVSISNMFKQFILQTLNVFPHSELMAPIAVTINESVAKAFNEVIWPDYFGDPNDGDDRPNKYEWKRFIERIGYCTNLIELAIKLCSDDEENDIQRYQNLIALHSKAIDSCSWKYTYASYSSAKLWSKEWMLSKEAKESRMQKIAEYKNKIAELTQIVERKAEEKRKERIKNYWESHKQEKAALDNETENLKAQAKQYTDEITQLEHQKDSVPARAQLIQVQKIIEQLKAEKKALGLFKGKEKKAVQEKIDVQKADENRLKLQVASQRQEIEQKIASIKANLNSAINRLKDIEIELTMDRDEDDEEDEEEI